MPKTKSSSTRRVECPRCGKAITVEVVSSLRPGDKHLAALMSGTLNRATCPGCKVEFLVETSLVYLDGQTSFIVYLLEPPEDGDTEALEHEVDCMATEVFSQENLERPQVRLTFTYPDFLEKIKLHSLGYDDRLIEYAKYQLFRNISEELLSKFQHKLLLDFSNRDKDKLIFLVYDRETNKPLSAVHVPMEDFRTLEREFAANLTMQQELDAIFPTCHVSADRLL
ncbi:MAG TPA: CpXC domain-containing protein [Lentisphaeria bacterium]|nr:hypothetical protein [Lentisphaerota bacterium]OQC15331.1 MAG: hypothetical protein BWX73_01374 [Lentisphaerae bacterium ADurb.Bin082]HPY89616.1 CpXC domain-containing protein [Lentisphaeria bacterium]HQC53306.1 CpXC domain-containing protein [Lentisphaeria bacterium]HQL86863.1 CpXC domain-containing protein [Lentisphaeria bacterium]